MNLEEVKNKISSLDKDQDLFIRYGDDAYPAKIRFFEENGKIQAYVDVDKKRLNEHRNFPGNYDKTKEVELS